MRPGRRLGVDVGRARVGVATCDPSGILATPVETVRRDLEGGADGGVDIARAAELIAELEAVEVIVGLPRHLSGAEGEAAADARSWATALARRVSPIPVRLVDERLTTVDAHRRLHESGRQGRSHRAVVDQVAAQLILQAAIDEERAAGRPAGELVDVSTTARDDVRGHAPADAATPTRTKPRKPRTKRTRTE